VLIMMSYDNFLTSGDIIPMIGKREISFSLDGISNDVTYLNKGNVDLSDFYEMEEIKKLSKIIQKKFRMINEKANKT